MKLIVAIVQPHRLDAVKKALTAVEVFRLTVSDVQGYGRQKGHTEYFRGQPMEVNLIRKVRIDVAVNENFVQPTIDAIIKGARSGTDGHGRVGGRQDLRRASGQCHPRQRRPDRRRGDLTAAAGVACPPAANLLPGAEVVLRRSMHFMEETLQKNADSPEGRISELVDVLDAASVIAATQRPVRLVARRGTGPRLIAELIHRTSARPKDAFVMVRCGLCPPSSVDRDLFGLRDTGKGNSRRTAGKILAADGGTLFIEQIQNASLTAQQALLRVLEDHEFTVGAATRAVNIRVIVSAPEFLESRVADGRFRADLYYRINMMPIPMSEKLLTREAILGILSTVRNACLSTPPRYSGSGENAASQPQNWGGNAGRIVHAVRMALKGVRANCSPEELLHKTLVELRIHLPEEAARRQLESAVVRTASQCVADHAALGPRIYDMLLIEVQRALIRRAVEECNGMLSRAAVLLGLTVHELETRMGDLGLTFHL